MSNKAKVIIFKPSGKFYTEEEWEIPEDAIGPYDMERSKDNRWTMKSYNEDHWVVLVESQEPWGYPHLLLSKF